MITENLRRLRLAADAVRGGFPNTTWKKISGPGPDELILNGHGGFDKLNLSEPGHKELVIQCNLDIPAEIMGIPLEGQPLEATLGSLHPADLYLDGKSLFSEPNLPVAPTPALFDVLPKLIVGNNGTLEMRIHLANYYMMPWVGLKLTTPNLRERFEQLDIAWAQLAIADAVATSPQERAAVEAAAEMVPQLIESRFGSSQPLFDKFAAALAPVHQKSSAISVELIGHSHIDMNWLWTWADTFQVIRRDFRSVLSLMDDYPELTFSHSQPAVYEVIRENDPDLFAKLLKQIKAGRWEATTLQWVEPDSNMPSGEAHVRQMLHAVHYTRDVLGATPRIFHSPDTFGHAGNLPQLAASAGTLAYYHHRANPGQANQWPAYWWEGQDGTRVLAFSTPSYNGEITAGDVANAAIRAHAAGHSVGLHFHGVGDHGGGPARQNLDTLRRLQKTPGLPKMACGSMEGYVRKILEAGAALPVHRGESSTIFEGCYTTHADTKRFNRDGENLLTTADALAAIANLNQNDQLFPAWRKVLFNQFHDILDGSAIHETYLDNAKDFQAIEAAGTAAIAASLDVLERSIPAGRIAVTNQLAFERSDVVTLKNMRGEGTAWLIGDHGHTTPGQYTEGGLVFVARVPALSTVSYAVSTQNNQPAPTNIEAIPKFAPTDPRSRIPAGEFTTEFPFLQIETPTFLANIRPDSGIIVSLIDKRVSRELVGFGRRRGSDYMDSARAELCLNVFQILDEHPHGMSSWQIHEVHTEHSLLRGATTKVAETGPVRCVLEVEHKVRNSTIKQRISFYHDLPRIDFDTKVDWHEIGNDKAGVPGLKAAFTAHLEECQAWYETPFGAARRPADGLEVPALRWANVGSDDYGFALLNDCKYGHDALGCRLRLTLLRSGYDPDPNSDEGTHHIRYSLLPHPGDWRDAGVVQTAASFNQPLLARLVTDHAGSGGTPPARMLPGQFGHPIVTSSGSVQVATLKTSHDGKARILRLYESAGRSAAVRISGLSASANVYETNVIEEPLRRLLPVNDGFELAFTPWQVRTIRIETV
jgi:alpha-mannosidase